MRGVDEVLRLGDGERRGAVRHPAGQGEEELRQFGAERLQLVLVAEEGAQKEQGRAQGAVVLEECVGSDYADEEFRQ